MTTPTAQTSGRIKCSPFAANSDDRQLIIPWSKVRVLPGPPPPIKLSCYGIEAGGSESLGVSRGGVAMDGEFRGGVRRGAARLGDTGEEVTLELVDWHLSRTVSYLSTSAMSWSGISTMIVSIDNASHVRGDHPSIRIRSHYFLFN